MNGYVIQYTLYTELLQELNGSMAAIKDFLLSGAQIYINGERV